MHQAGGQAAQRCPAQRYHCQVLHEDGGVLQLSLIHILCIRDRSYAFRLKGIDEMRDTLQAERYMKENRAVQVFYLYGDSGTGKTRSIFCIP